MSGITERLRTVSVVVVLFLLAGGVLVLLLRLTEGNPPLEIVLPTPTAAAKPLKVYITGAVAQPGVYALGEGDRIEEAVRAAGGATLQADLLRLNLALLLRDEMHIHVPALGEPATETVRGGDSQKININTASVELLDTLPDIGRVRAGRIVEHRTKNGPFKSIEELRELKLIPSSTFEKIKGLITVR